MTIAELVDSVQAYDPTVDGGVADARLRGRRPGPRGPARRLGRVVHRAPAGGRRDPGRARDGPRRRSPPRCCTTSSKTRRSPANKSPREFGEEVAQPGRRRHQAHAHSVPVQGRRAGREPAQDVHGDGQGHPRHHHQARRPPAQHAHAREPAAAKAAGDRARDARHLRADRAPPGHLEDQMGDRGRVPAISRSRRRTAKSSSASPRRAASARATSTKRSSACATSSRR